MTFSTLLCQGKAVLLFACSTMMCMTCVNEKFIKNYQLLRAAGSIPSLTWIIGYSVRVFHSLVQYFKDVTRKGIRPNECSIRVSRALQY